MITIGDRQELGWKETGIIIIVEGNVQPAIIVFDTNGATTSTKKKWKTGNLAHRLCTAPILGLRCFQVIWHFANPPNYRPTEGLWCPDRRVERRTVSVVDRLGGCSLTIRDVYLGSVRFDRSPVGIPANSYSSLSRSSICTPRTGEK